MARLLLLQLTGPRLSLPEGEEEEEVLPKRALKMEIQVKQPKMALATAGTMAQEGSGLTQRIKPLIMVRSKQAQELGI